MIKRWDIISKIILENRLSTGAEVGVQYGKNIENILSQCPDFKILAIDCWDPTFKYQTWTKASQLLFEKLFDKVVAKFPGRIEKIKGYSTAVVQKIPYDSLDLVFLDASHDYFSTAAGIRRWLPKVRPGGFIGGHDYGHPKFPGVKKAVDECFINVSIYPDYVWFTKKRGHPLYPGDRIDVAE